MGAYYHSVALLGGLLGPVTSTKLTLARALVAVRDLVYEELSDRYTLKAGQVWTAGGMRIMIRDHYPALFRSMCKNANVDTIGDDTAWGGSFTGGHALLRGTAGTGTSAFMFVMFIEFLKMLRAPPTEDVVKVDGVVVFNPAVASIRIQWDGVHGGNSIVIGESLDHHRRVHLFDAGADKPVRRLPGSQGEGYFLATSSANPQHYHKWDSKRYVKRQFSVLWSVEELLRLIQVLGLTDRISAQQVYDRYAVVGGVPRLILRQDASQLLKTVQAQVKDITMDMVRTVIQNDPWTREDLLRTDSTSSFSMFAMDVRAEGDFDDVRVCHQAPLVKKCGTGTRTQRWASTHLQVKFLTRTVKAEFFAQAAAETVSKLEAELSEAVKHGRAHTRGDSFEDVALLKLSRDGFNGEIRVLLPGGAEHVATMYLCPSLVRSFVNAEHLASLVETDLRNGEFRIYIPMAQNNPLVDAWCICTIGEESFVAVGLQMTVAKLKHPIAGEDVAKAQFNAIHGAFATHGVAVHKAAWVVFVLPSANYAKFPYQYAKVGPGQERRPAGRTWAHTQAKLAMQLGDQGKPPANLAAMRDNLAQGTAVELSAHAAAGDLCTLKHMGPKRASKLLSVLRRDKSKTAEGFLNSLESSHKALASVLMHEDNLRRWAYRGQVWFGPAPAPAPVPTPTPAPTAMRQKRKSRAHGASVAGSPHGPMKRARRGKLTGGTDK